jgi:hypothetical protein
LGCYSLPLAVGLGLSFVLAMDGREKLVHGLDDLFRIATIRRALDALQPGDREVNRQLDD